MLILRKPIFFQITMKLFCPVGLYFDITTTSCQMKDAIAACGGRIASPSTAPSQLSEPAHTQPRYYVTCIRLNGCSSLSKNVSISTILTFLINVFFECFDPAPWPLWTACTDSLERAACPAANGQYLLWKDRSVTWPKRETRAHSY